MNYPTSEVRGGSRGELPHARGQGHWPRGATSRPSSGALAETSYPTSEVRGGRTTYRTPEVRGGGREGKPHNQGAVAAQAQEGPEELLHLQGQEGVREDIPLVQGQGRRDELPHARRQGQRPRQNTSRQRSGAAAGRSNPTLKERRLRRAERSYSTFKVRRRCSEIPLVQGKEQRLRFAGATVK